jgi:TRAP-type mannitol/chloroaromatic compound transport system permease large subunit
LSHHPPASGNAFRSGEAVQLLDPPTLTPECAASGILGPMTVAWWHSRLSLAVLHESFRSTMRITEMLSADAVFRAVVAIKSESIVAFAFASGAVD